VAGGVNQIDAVLSPLDLSRGGGNCNTPFTFQFHKIHGSAGTVALDFIHTMYSAGIKQNPFTERCFARVDMRRYSDIPNFTDSFHCFSLLTFQISVWFFFFRFNKKTPPFPAAIGFPFPAVLVLS
jgi:hypothetical protein